MNWSSLLRSLRTQEGEIRQRSTFKTASRLRLPLCTRRHAIDLQSQRQRNRDGWPIALLLGSASAAACVALRPLRRRVSIPGTSTPPRTVALSSLLANSIPKPALRDGPRDELTEGAHRNVDRRTAHEPRSHRVPSSSLLRLVLCRWIGSTRVSAIP